MIPTTGRKLAKLEAVVKTVSTDEGVWQGTGSQPFALPSSRDHHSRFALDARGHCSCVSFRHLKLPEDFLSSLEETHHMPHVRASRAPESSLVEKQHAGKTSSAGAGRRSTADLSLCPTTIIKILKLKRATS